MRRKSATSSGSLTLAGTGAYEVSPIVCGLHPGAEFPVLGRCDEAASDGGECRFDSSGGDECGLRRRGAAAGQGGRNDDPGLNTSAVQMEIRPAGGLPGRWTGRRAAMPAGRRR